MGVWTFSLCGSAALRWPFPCPIGLGHISMTRLVSGACWKPSGILLVPDRSTAEMLHRENAPPPHSAPAVYQKLELHQQHNLLHNVTPHLNDKMSGNDQAQVQSPVDGPQQGRVLSALFPLTLFTSRCGAVLLVSLRGHPPPIHWTEMTTGSIEIASMLMFPAAPLWSASSPHRRSTNIHPDSVIRLPVLLMRLQYRLHLLASHSLSHSHL